MLLNADDPRVVTPDSELGLKYGFNSKDFDGYLWIDKADVISIPAIISWNPHKGNFRKLLDNLRQDYNILIMHPCDRMKLICHKYGMRYFKDFDVCAINKLARTVGSV